MTCHEVREGLSAYVDAALDPDERARVEAHLETCAECRHELAGLRETVALLRRVEPARAPVGFVDRVVAAAGPRPWYRRVVDAAFLPLSMKLPLEATALVMVALLAVYLFERTPELEQAARPETSRFEPAMRADRPGADRARPEAPARERREPLFADRAARAVPPAPAPAEAPPPARAGGERDVAPPIAAPPPAATAPAPTAAPPPPTAAPGAKAEIRAETKKEVPSANVTGAPPRPELESGQRALESSSDSTRAAPSSPRPAAKRALLSADVVARVAVKDRDAAERDLAALIARVGGSVTQRRREDEATVVEALIPQPRYAEFSESLARVGAWQVEAERPDLPAQVRVILRLQ
ncbi:MAG: zf-HC2 domain-containing protein [Candidatus Rokuibacteriota bacterium]